MHRTKRPIPLRILSRANDIVRVVAFLAFEYLLPKQSRSWCFCTWNTPYPHTLDNPRGVFEAVKSDPSIKKIILLKPYHTTAGFPIEGTNVSFVNVETLRGAYLLARSKVIIMGYSLRGLCSFGLHVTHRHDIIQVWHGIPLKRIGKLFPSERFWDSETLLYAATVCSAPQDRDFMSAAFSPIPHVWLTGLPRNDLILKPERELPRDYQDTLSQLRKYIAGRKFILYAPTWRDHNSGIYPFSESQLAALKALLARRNASIGIRAHANRRPDENPPDFGDDIFFVNEIPDANILLRLADVLVTDYSSIYIDFLLTGRPILNFTYDLESYVKERGFLYNLAEALPSTPIRTFEELLASLETALDGQPANAAQYAHARALFHSHGGSSSADVADRIRELSEAPFTHQARHAV